MAVRSTQLVGRESELHSVRTAIDQGRGIFFAGPAGVGKTRLLKEARTILEGENFDVIDIVGAQATADIPLAPLLGLVDLDQQGDLARLALSALTRRARDNTVAMLVDDIQRLDDASASLIHRIAASGTAIVFATYRSTESLPPAAESLWKDEHLDRVPVEPLSREHQEELASLMIGKIDGESEAWLWDTAAGHPLFLRELLVDAEQSGRVIAAGNSRSVEQSSGVPKRLFELVGRNVTALDPHVRRALELVAVGGSAPTEVIVELASANAVRELIEGGLCNVVGDRLFLGHPLFGETATDSLTVDAVCELQRSLAEGLEARADTEVQASLLRISAGDTADETRLRRAFETANRSRQPETIQRIGEALHNQTGDPVVAAQVAFAYAMSRDWARADELFHQAVADASTDVVEELYLLWLQASFEYRDSPHEAMELAQFVVENTTGPANQVARALQFRVRMFFEPMEPILTEREKMLDEDLDVRAEILVRLDQATVAWSMLRIPTSLREPFAHDMPGVGLLDESRSRQVAAAAGAFANGITPTLATVDETHKRFVAMGDADAEATVFISLWCANAVGLNVTEVREAVRKLESVERRATDRRYHAMLLGIDHLTASRQVGFSNSAESILKVIDELDPTSYALSAVNLYLVASRALRRDGLDHEPLRQKALEVADWRDDRLSELLALRDEYAFGDAASTGTVARLRELADIAGPGLLDLYASEGEAHLARDGSRLGELSVAAEEYGARGLAWDMAAGAQLFLTESGDGAAALRAERRSHRLAALDPLAQSPLHELMRPVLTAREIEVAELVAAGLSNSDVADRLYLSPRTVGRHLERIYKRLNISTRAELSQILQDG